MTTKTTCREDVAGARHGSDRERRGAGVTGQTRPVAVREGAALRGHLGGCRRPGRSTEDDLGNGRVLRPP